MMPFLPRKALIVSCLLLPLSFGLATPSAHAQNQNDLKAVLDQLKRLEQDIATLSRTVYRNSPVAQNQDNAIQTLNDPLSSPADSTASDQLFDRIQTLENNLRQTTGKIEVIEHHMAQTLQRLESLQQELDIRLSRLQQGGGTGNTAFAGTGTQPGAIGTQTGIASVTPQENVTLTAPPGVAGVPDDQVVAPQTTVIGGSQQQGVLGQISATEAQQADQGIVGITHTAAANVAANATTQQPALNTTSQPGLAATTATAAAPAVDASLPPEEQYEQSMRLIRAKDYAAAESGLRSFIDSNGSHSLVPNAQYWLGETLYVRKSYIEAAKTFLAGYQNYPDSGKAPDSLLKLGMSLHNIGETGQACSAYKQLQAKFPDASASIRRRAALQIKQANCAE